MGKGGKKARGGTLSLFFEVCTCCLSCTDITDEMGRGTKTSKHTYNRAHRQKYIRLHKDTHLHIYPHTETTLREII